MGPRGSFYDPVWNQIETEMVSRWLRMGTRLPLTSESTYSFELPESQGANNGAGGSSVG
jgi:hypothetical protein